MDGEEEDIIEPTPGLELTDRLDYRSLVYIEGDCSMSKFNDKEGKPTSALSIIQRELTPLRAWGSFASENDD